jgi:E1A/CREB-binding protein
MLSNQPPNRPQPPAPAQTPQVRQKFMETFQKEPGGYPDAFPYRQRVALLYQRTDGVDVCLFCMYVQEYGPDCPAPNR